VNCPKPILCELGPFCERPHRRSQLGAKVKSQKPPTPSTCSKVSDSGDSGERNFFEGGGLLKNCQRRFWDFLDDSETFILFYLLSRGSTWTLHFAPKVLKLDPCGFGGEGANPGIELKKTDPVKTLVVLCVPTHRPRIRRFYAPLSYPSTAVSFCFGFCFTAIFMFLIPLSAQRKLLTGA
jgi:hypothetical protein